MSFLARCRQRRAWLQDFARRAEDVGFDGVWVFDDLFDAPPSYRVVFLEPVTTLTLVIPATWRVTIGTASSSFPLRDPVVTAKAFANLDVASEGRLIFGVGVAGRSGSFAPARSRRRRAAAAWTRCSRSSRGSGPVTRSRTRAGASRSPRSGSSPGLCRRPAISRSAPVSRGGRAGSSSVWAWLGGAGVSRLPGLEGDARPPHGRDARDHQGALDQ